ncbi:TRAP transporter small permease [Neobacillus niacini]|uniref:TRAP transporter small permease n=1 Tax=Neobacillus niacini TaxID=86668 RepID=UPI00203FB307|nr:TRAP transporter small permease [Neobacillus niacini]MCM3691073.1 TRAP transporter small permease [Neobacillus niacini]
MKLVNIILDKIDYVCTYVAGITMLVLTVWIFMDSILRTTLNSPIVGTIEVTGEYLLVLIVYLSISYTFKHDGHVSVDFLESKFSKPMKKYVRVLNNLIAFFAFLVLGIYNFLKGIEYFEKNIRSAGMLDYPLAPAMMVISFGIFLLSVRLLVDTINILRGTKEV